MADDTGPEVPQGAAVFPLIPVELGIHPLLLAVLHAVVFLDGSNADVVDPDAAVESLEYFATYLQRLRGPELRRVHEDVECLAAYGRSQGWSKPQVRFLKDFMTTFGVGDEGEARD
jgi:hypothetical protein